MVGYPLLLRVLDKVLHPLPIEADTMYKPSVTYMIVAHNEEKVIEEKLENAIQLEYPKEKFEILVASDNSTDRTNEIVKEFITAHADYSIRLYESLQHKGKTNAQNEAQKTVSSEILVMTDANTIVEKNAINELISYFSSEDIVYVCGKLVYSNSSNVGTGNSEATYWDLDLSMRDVESRMQTITAGNGALYACKNSEYIDFDPICCHDSAMPYAYALQNKRAVFNPSAIAVEKAGDNNGDEFKRKVRMNRIILRTLRDSVFTINFFKYHWFSVFYFGHRTCRYSLWLAHILVLSSTAIMMFCGSRFGTVMTILQLLGFLIAFVSVKFAIKNKILRMIGYYGLTIWAQIVGIIRILSGKAKPVWEKAESTR